MCMLTSRMPATPSLQQNAEPPTFNPATIKEFTPQNYDLANSVCAGVDSASLWWKVMLTAF